MTTNNSTSIHLLFGIKNTVPNPAVFFDAKKKMNGGISTIISACFQGCIQGSVLLITITVNNKSSISGDK